MSNKVVDGVELLRMIRDNEIKEGTEIYRTIYNGAKEKIVYESFQLRKVYENGGRKIFFQEYNLLTLKEKFEIIEDEGNKEIDIQAIEELQYKMIEHTDSVTRDFIVEPIEPLEKEMKNKINEIIKAVKQLDNKIK